MQLRTASCSRRRSKSNKLFNSSKLFFSFSFLLLKLFLQMEKELDETFSERRLLVEAEARAKSWLGSHT